MTIATADTNFVVRPRYKKSKAESRLRDTSGDTDVKWVFVMPIVLILNAILVSAISLR